VHTLTGLLNQKLMIYPCAGKYHFRLDYSGRNSLAIRFSIRLNTVTISLGNLFVIASPELLSLILERILRRICRLEADLGLNKRMTELIGLEFPETGRTKPTRTVEHYTPAGRYFDLKEIFERLNLDWFRGSLSCPTLGWSKYVSRRRLGFYDQQRNLMVISRIFDQKNVPPQVVEFIVFHEMLHIVFPSEKGRSRRIVHSREFRRAERSHPFYDFAETWLQKNLHRI